MVTWLERVNDLSRRRARLAEQTLEHDALAQKLDAQRAALMRLVEDMSPATDAALPIEALYKHARASFDLLQAGWTETRAGIALRDKATKASRGRRKPEPTSHKRTNVCSPHGQMRSPRLDLAGALTKARRRPKRR